MMKTIKYGLLTLVMLMATTSCTHNDGDPNGWYGTWHIDAIESANAPYINSIILEDVDYYVQFQSSVICAILMFFTMVVRAMAAGVKTTE